MRHKTCPAPLIFIIALALSPTASFAETVSVKYRGPVNLDPFVCTETPRSSFVRRVCYDGANAYMLIQLKTTWYHYCAIDDGTVKSLLAAESVGTFYNASVKGQFDCRVNPMPAY